jgi:adenosine/AMP kinase
MVTLSSVAIQKPEAVNVILGQAHFIKTVEDLHEALVCAVPESPSVCRFAREPAPKADALVSVWTSRTASLRS